jgi:putative phosphoesterase
MRIAIIADIHANRIALDAVLADIEALRPDQIVCLGDVAATGPQPRQVVERLRSLGCLVVMGNADAWLLDPQPGEASDEDTRRVEAIDSWCAAQLAPADLAYLRTFQPTIELRLAGDAVLLCYHGSPRSNTEIIQTTTPDAELAPMLGGRRAALLAGGHTHIQMLRRYRDMILLNPGSVGNPPWAEYALVGWADGALNIELRRVPVDIDAIVQAARASTMPHAEWWAQDWQLE